MSRIEVQRRSRWFAGGGARMFIYLVVILKVVHRRLAMPLSALSANVITAHSLEA